MQEVSSCQCENGLYLVDAMESRSFCHPHTHTHIHTRLVTDTVWLAQKIQHGPPSLWHLSIGSSVSSWSAILPETSREWNVLAAFDSNYQPRVWFAKEQMGLSSLDNFPFFFTTNTPLVYLKTIWRPGNGGAVNVDRQRNIVSRTALALKNRPPEKYWGFQNIFSGMCLAYLLYFEHMRVRVYVREKINKLNKRFKDDKRHQVGSWLQHYRLELRC